MFGWVDVRLSCGCELWLFELFELCLFELIGLFGLFELRLFELVELLCCLRCVLALRSLDLLLTCAPA